MKTTAKKICCPDCKQEATAEKDCIAVCENYAIMTCTNQCKVNDKVLCTILDQNNCKYQVIVTQDVLGKALKVSMKDKMNFWKQFMNNRFKRPH